MSGGADYDFESAPYDVQRFPPSQSLGAHSAPDTIAGILPAYTVHLLSGAVLSGRTSLIGKLLGELQTCTDMWGCQVTPPAFIGYVTSHKNGSEAIPTLMRGGWAEPAVFSFADDPSAQRLLEELAPATGQRKPATTVIWTAAIEHFRLQYFPSRPPTAPLPASSLIVVDGMELVFGIDPMGERIHRLLAPLAWLKHHCRAQQLTVLLVNTAAKQVAGRQNSYIRAIDKTYGTVTLQTGVGTQLLFEEPALAGRKDDLYTLTVAPRDTGCKVFAVYYARTGSGAFQEVGYGDAQIAPGALGDAVGAGVVVPLAGAAHAVLEALQSEPEAFQHEGVESRKVYKALSSAMPSRTYQRALHTLEDVGRLTLRGKTKSRRIKLAPLSQS